MIANRFLRCFGATSFARLTTGPTFRSGQQPSVSGSVSEAQPAVVSKQELSEQEGRDDDLYRHLWIKCRAHETATLDSYETFVKMAADNLNITFVRSESPFRTIKRKTMLASRFVKKKYRVQYEVRTYNRDMLFQNLTGSTADTFLEYIERNLPEGVMLIAEKHRLAPLPFDLVSDEGTQPHVEDTRTKDE